MEVRRAKPGQSWSNASSTQHDYSPSPPFYLHSIPFLSSFYFIFVLITSPGEVLSKQDMSGAPVEWATFHNTHEKTHTQFLNQLSRHGLGTK